MSGSNRKPDVKNFLQLNDSKVEVIIIPPSGPSTANISKLSYSLGALSNHAWKEAHGLGVIYDSVSSFDT